MRDRSSKWPSIHFDRQTYLGNAGYHHGPWNKAKIAVFYPEPFGRSPHWGQHFVAYVRGANGIKELPEAHE